MCSAYIVRKRRINFQEPGVAIVMSICSTAVSLACRTRLHCSFIIRSYWIQFNTAMFFSSLFAFPEPHCFPSFSSWNLHLFTIRLYRTLHYPQAPQKNARSNGHDLLSLQHTRVSFDFDLHEAYMKPSRNTSTTIRILIIQGQRPHTIRMPTSSRRRAG